MTTTIKFANKLYAMEPQPMAPDPKPIALSLLSPSELLTIYNLVSSNLGRGRVNRFSDKNAAVRRTWAILQEYDADFDGDAPVEKTKSTPTPAPTPTPTPAPADKPKREGKKRGMRFVFPAESEQKPVRAESARGKALALLQRDKGATFEEIQKATGWNEKQAYEGIRLVHYYSGYGLAQEERDGKVFIRAHTGKK